MFRHLFFVLATLLFISCSNPGEKPQKTLTLSLVSQPGAFQLIGYTILDKPFEKSQQQGLYQAQLLDKEGCVLRKISFEKMEVPTSQSESDERRFFVSVPLAPGLERIDFYRLDGSSGHYTLKDDDPLLSWTLPEEVWEDLQKTDIK
ncbi:hypothetical protein [Fodinibius salsisoli]|uniref:Lipoprotein n=1 Tax=Fodinibius salsisoli TaxID=2820877 RepID=A0ABT3PJZ2_9BACT|nr:hypothetical protein [Fodinibius salsisoli]MCW9706180.1 hypothetical protein [Fodinibius salsisoli]